MSILDRLSRLLRANVNDLINRAENPSLIIEQALRDMRSAYAEARSEVADAMGQNAKLDREASSNRRIGTLGDAARSQLPASKPRIIVPNVGMKLSVR